LQRVEGEPIVSSDEEKKSKNKDRSKGQVTIECCSINRKPMGLSPGILQRMGKEEDGQSCKYAPNERPDAAITTEPVSAYFRNGKAPRGRVYGDRAPKDIIRDVRI